MIFYILFRSIELMADVDYDLFLLMISSIDCNIMVFRRQRGERKLCISLQWRHNGHYGFSNHQPYDCLFNRLFRRRSKKASKFRVTGFVRGIHRWQVNSPQIGPVTQKMFPFDDIIMSPKLSKTYTKWNDMNKTFGMKNTSPLIKNLIIVAHMV